MNKKVLSSRKN